MKVCNNTRYVMHTAMHTVSAIQLLEPACLPGLNWQLARLRQPIRVDSQADYESINAALSQ